MLARGRWHRPPPSRRETRVVALGSIGVTAGQTTVAAHLAMAMANLGAQVIAVDLDERAPSLSRRLGVEPPRLGWHALIDREIHTLDLSLTRSPVRNLQVLCAGTSRAHQPAGAQRAKLDDGNRQLLLQQLRGQGADVVILDLPRPTRDELAAWLALVEAGLLVTPCDRAALARGMDLIVDLARMPDDGDSDDAVPEAVPPEPAIGARLIGNLAAGPEDVEVLHAFTRLLRAEVSLDLPVLGCVLAQDRLADVEPPDHTLPGQISFDANAQAFQRMGEILLHEDLASAGDTDGVVTAPSSSLPTARADDRAPEAGAAITPADAGAGGVALKPVADPAGLLAKQLDRHRRKQVRVDVDWVATLLVGTRPVAVRVVDVSMSGAALEIASPLALGTAATLVFDQLARQPSVPVLVKSLRPEVGRAGVAFIGSDEIRRDLVAAAHEQQAPAPDSASDEEPTRPLRVPSGG